MQTQCASTSTADIELPFPEFLESERALKSSDEYSLKCSLHPLFPKQQFQANKEGFWGRKKIPEKQKKKTKLSLHVYLKKKKKDKETLITHLDQWMSK